MAHYFIQVDQGYTKVLDVVLDSEITEAGYYVPLYADHSKFYSALEKIEDPVLAASVLKELTPGLAPIYIEMVQVPVQKNATLVIERNGLRITVHARSA